MHVRGRLSSSTLIPMIGNIQMTVRFPRELRDLIKERAERNHRSLCAELTVLLETALAAEQTTATGAGA